jgi:hypothetical protein
MPLYTFFLHSLLNVPVQIANKMGLQKKLRKLRTEKFVLCCEIKGIHTHTTEHLDY